MGCFRYWNCINYARRYCKYCILVLECISDMAFYRKIPWFRFSELVHVISMRAGNSTLFFPISLIVCSDPKYFCTCYSTDDANESTLHYRFLFILVDPVNEPYVKLLEHSFSLEIKDIMTTTWTRTIINNLHLFKLPRWRSCLERLPCMWKVADQIPTGYTQVFKSGRDNVTAKRSTRSANVNGFTDYTIKPWFVSQYM